MPRNRLLLSLLTVILFFFSFPPFVTGFLSYVVLVPFFLILEMNDFKRGFRTGYLLGLFTLGVMMYWLNWNSGATLVQAIGLYLGTILYLALYWGLYGLLQNYICRKIGLLGFSLAPFLWTAIDYLQSLGELGFTWHSLPSTQTYYTPAIQFIDYTGMYGITFWIVTLNTLSFFIIKIGWQAASIRHLNVMRLTVALIALLVVPWIYGLAVLSNPDMATEKKVRVAIIQPNIEPNRKWLEQNFAYYELMRLTSTIRSQKTDLIVWPETAIPNRLRYEVSKKKDILDTLRSQWAVLLTGIPDRKLAKESDGHVAPHYFNSIFLLRPDQTNMDYYDKIHLVPFGERVPDFLFFMNGLAMDIGASDYFAGDSVKIFTLPLFAHGVVSDSVPFAAVICLESVFPQIVREGILKGAQFLVIVTNDAWYDGTLAPAQHAQIAVLRAIENRVPVVRCANSGISNIIDPSGVVREQTHNGEEIILSGTITPQLQRTFFTRHGNWFPDLVLFMVFISLGILFTLDVLKKVRESGS
jgi:apolipoprotein N-acyltransferase